MDLTKAQWEIVEPLFPPPKKGPNGSGRPPQPARDVLCGVLWILRTGARWADLPERYPPYQTCHRRFQQWVKDGTLIEVLEALWEDLRERGGIDNIESFIDGTYIPAKKGAYASETRAGGGRQRSWLWRTAMVFHSLLLLMEETDTTLFSPSEYSTLHSWLSSRQSWLGTKPGTALPFRRSLPTSDTSS